MAHNAEVPDKQLNFLAKVSLFAGTDRSYLAQLAADFRTRNYRKGDTIFHQGDQSRELYVVMEGKVRVFHLTPAGEETTVNILVPRHIIGEFAIIDGQPRSATAKAINACTLLEISQARFQHYLETVPGLALAMCRQLVVKVRWTSMYAETIARLDAAGRLLQLLLHYNQAFGQAEVPGQRYVLELGLNQTDLATLIGTGRSWVNKILQDWRNRGLVEFEAGRITILDLARVEAERDSRLNVSH